jgi:predicted O-methyltransferase YrrM
MFNTIEDIEKYAKNKNILLLNSEIIDYIKRRIKLFNLNKILEIESPLAYSIINFADANENIKITDFEFKRNNFIDNIKMIKEFNIDEKVTVFFTNVNDITFNNKYNLINLNIINKDHLQLFDKLKEQLENNGFITISNIDYYKKLKRLSKNNDSKQAKDYLTSIEKVLEYFDTNDDFLVEYIDLADGLLVAQKVVK